MAKTLRNSIFDGSYYGLGEMGPSAIDFFLKVYLLVFYNQNLHLSANLAGLALGLSVFWDAAIDPLIGSISDRLYSKFGSRQHMMWVGLLLLILSFVALWNPPSAVIGDGETSLFWYLLIASSLANSSYSVFIIPYLSVANDLRHDHVERARWLGWRTAFLNIGAFVGLGVPAYFLTSKEFFSPNRVHGDLGGHSINSIFGIFASFDPYSFSSLVIALVVLIGGGASLLVTFRQNKEAGTVATMPSGKLRDIFADLTFMKLLFGFCILSIGMTLNSSLAVYYYKQRLHLTEGELQVVLLLFLSFFTFSIPLWITLARRYRLKNLIGLGGIALGLSNALIYPLLPEKNLAAAVFFASGLGGFLVGVAVLLEVFLSGLLRKREKHLQLKISGSYFGVWKTGSKISRAFALALTGPILQFALQDESGLRLANIFGGGVGFFFVLAGLFVLLKIDEDVLN